MFSSKVWIVSIGKSPLLNSFCWQTVGDNTWNSERTEILNVMIDSH